MSIGYQNLLKKAVHLDSSVEFGGYSKVVITVGTDTEGNPLVIEAGDDSGKTLEITNPFATQQMANNILSIIQGYQYQPYSATDALLDPAMQLGDAVSVNGVYSGIYCRATNFGTQMRTDISAPVDEEIEHEFVVESSTDRAYQRTVKELKGRISVNATNINAKVSKQESNSEESFGWNLTSDEWTVFSGSESNTILKASESGLEVKGKITSTEGQIGGFTISASALYNGMTSFSDTSHDGVYVGTDGIALGKGKFKVDSSGHLSCSGADVSGAINCSSLTVNGHTYTPSEVSGGISGGRSYSSSGISGSSSSKTLTTNWMKINYLTVSNSLSASDIYIGQKKIKTTTFKDYYGTSRTVLTLG